MNIRRVVVAIVIAGSVFAGAVPSGASPPSSRFLAATDFPAGWTKAPLLSSGTPKGSCLYVTSVASGNQGVFFHDHVKGTGIVKVLVELLVTGKSQVRKWQQLRRALAACRRFTYPYGKTRVTVKVSPLSLPTVGTSSSAYVAAFTTRHTVEKDDIVLFNAHPYYGVLVYGNPEDASLATLQMLATKAAAKAAGSPVSAASSTG
jgi:hypothetical protein